MRAALSTICRNGRSRLRSVLIFFDLLAFSISAMAQEAVTQRLDSYLSYMLWMRESGEAALLNASELDHELARVSIRFKESPSSNLIHSLEVQGVHFDHWQGKILHVGRIYEADVSWGDLRALSERKEVDRIEGVDSPDRMPAMDVSGPEVQAHQVWQIQDENGVPVTGKGVVIGVQDDVPDIFHPALWHADGDTLRWLDNNLNGVFDSGLDGVDLNKNGRMDSGETLAFWDAPFNDYWNLYHNVLNVYEVDRDWLYNDANGNRNRDCGLNHGFTEADATYGERLFIAEDRNRNNSLDLQESLIALKTCKVRGIRIRVTDSVTHTQTWETYIRGQNLIEVGDNSSSHATPVAGTLVGGWPGHHIFTGIAPNAEVVFGSAVWTAEMGAKVILYEWGSHMAGHLDGSSNYEELIDSLAFQGIIQVVPAGNLGGSEKHFFAEIPPNDSIKVRIDSPPEPRHGNPMDMSILWRAPENRLKFWLVMPEGNRVLLSGQGQDFSAEGFNIWSEYSISARRTRRIFAAVIRPNGTEGIWTIIITNSSDVRQPLDGYVFHYSFGWLGGPRFLEFVTSACTVTLPATADSAITVGSYNSRGLRWPLGELSLTSGRGPRIDGFPVMDVVAPGSEIYTLTVRDAATNMYGGYMPISGTSFSAPHVAGACALLLQKNPKLSPGEIRRLLREGALEDEFTGAIPNDAWGAGKLRILRSIDLMTNVENHSISSATLPAGFRLQQNFPNPLHDRTTIHYNLVQGGEVSIAIFDLLGQEIRTLVSGPRMAGRHWVRWDANDNLGRRVPNGIYFCRMKHRESTQFTKMIVLQ